MPDAAARSVAHRAGHFPSRIVDAQARWLDLPECRRRHSTAAFLGPDRWLIRSKAAERPSIHSSFPEEDSFPLNSRCDLLEMLTLGHLRGAQVSPGGCPWGGNTDEGVFRGGGAGGVVCIDPDGKRVFDVHHAVGESGPTPIVCLCNFLNVASDDLTLLGYDGFFNERSHGSDKLVASILNFTVLPPTPWSCISIKAPVEGPNALDLWGDRVLVCGHGRQIGVERLSEDCDHSRLYLISLTSMRSQKLLPVDRHGRRIGPFPASGHGSRINHSTGSTLFVVDAAELPRWS